MRREELVADCRKSAEQFYLTHSIEQVIDHLAELMAERAELSTALELRPAFAPDCLKPTDPCADPP